MRRTMRRSSQGHRPDVDSRTDAVLVVDATKPLAPRRLWARTSFIAPLARHLLRSIARSTRGHRGEHNVEDDMRAKLAGWAVGVCGMMTFAGGAQAQCALQNGNQAAFFEHDQRGGRCRLLGNGNYSMPSQFSPVPNDAISSLNVGYNVRVVLYQNSNFGGLQAHYEGGYIYNSLFDFNDSASSIKVYPMSGGPAATYFLGDYPKERENFFSQNVQGLAHDSGYWFITNTENIFKVPLSYDLNSSSHHPSFPPVKMPLPLGLMGYDHFGDPDVRDGFLFVPIEGPGKAPRVAVFRTSDLAYLSSVIIPGPPNKPAPKNAGWAAIGPTTRTLWVSPSDLGPGPNAGIREYTIDWNTLNASGVLSLSFNRELMLRDRDGATMDIRSMQGGVFNPTGTLFYQINGYCDSVGGDGARIRVFDQSGILQARSENGYGPFDFESHGSPDALTCLGQEPEGLDYFDVVGRGVPGIPQGQVHTFLLDNEWFLFGEDDDVYMKHYSL